MSGTRDGSERGDATVEFLGVVVVLVIPLLYVVLAVGAVSAGAMALDGSRACGPRGGPNPGGGS